MTARVTDAQRRVLRFLAEHPEWHLLGSMDRIRLLERDDVLVVPSLVERGWVEQIQPPGVYRISALGRVIAGELSP